MLLTEDRQVNWDLVKTGLICAAILLQAWMMF